MIMNKSAAPQHPATRERWSLLRSRLALRERLQRPLRMARGLGISRVRRDALPSSKDREANALAVLAEGIRHVLADQRLRAALVQRGAERVTTEFGQDAIMAQYLALYRCLART